MAAPATTGDRIILGAQGDFRLVDLGETGQRRAARRDHGPAKFGAQEPRRLVGAEAELVAELQGRNAVGMGGHETGRPEPGRQRQLRPVHNGPRGDRGLLAAGGTLEGEGLSAMRPSLLMGAGRTAEARRPTRGEQPSRAGGFIRVASLKVAERSREVGHDGASEAAMFALRSYQPTPRLSLHLPGPDAEGSLRLTTWDIKHQLPDRDAVLARYLEKTYNEYIRRYGPPPLNRLRFCGRGCGVFGLP